MPYKNVNQQRAFNRQWQRKRRAQGSTDSKVPTLEWKLQNIEDLKAVLNIIVTQLLEADDLDLSLKARNLSALLTVGLKMLQQGELEIRMTAIEERLGISAGPVR